MLQQINITHSGFEKSCPTRPTDKPDQIQPSGQKITAQAHQESPNFRAYDTPSKIIIYENQIMCTNA